MRTLVLTRYRQLVVVARLGSLATATICSLVVMRQVRAEGTPSCEVEAFEYVSPTPGAVLPSCDCVPFVARASIRTDGDSRRRLDFVLTINGCRFRPFEITLVSATPEAGSFQVKVTWNVKVRAPVARTEVALKRIDGETHPICAIRRDFDVVVRHVCRCPSFADTVIPRVCAGCQVGNSGCTRTNDSRRRSRMRWTCRKLMGTRCRRLGPRIGYCAN